MSKKTIINPRSAVKPASEIVAFASIKAAAGGLKIDVPILKDAKAKGCSAFRSNGSVHRAELLAWLAEERAEAEKRKAEAPEEPEAPEDFENEARGVGRAFRSLQEYERTARRALDEANKGTNSEIIRRREDAWLKVLRELLRYELSVETAKRESGELIPKDRVIDGIRALLAWHTVGTSDAIRNFIPSCEMRSKVDIARIIDPALRAGIYRALEAGVKIGKIPDWMAEIAKNPTTEAELS